MLQLLNSFVVFVLLLFQRLDLRLTTLDLLVDELHAFAHILATLVQFLTHQHRSVQLVDLKVRLGGRLQMVLNLAIKGNCRGILML